MTEIAPLRRRQFMALIGMNVAAFDSRARRALFPFATAADDGGRQLYTVEMALAAVVADMLAAAGLDLRHACSATALLWWDIHPRLTEIGLTVDALHCGNASVSLWIAVPILAGGPALGDASIGRAPDLAASFVKPVGKEAVHGVAMASITIAAAIVKDRAAAAGIDLGDYFDRVPL